MKRWTFAAVSLAALVCAAGIMYFGRAEEAPAGGDPLVAKLDGIGRVASIIMDGDDCLTIVTDRAEEWLFRRHPQDQWFASDNYDVNFEPFVRNKKLLIRLSKLEEFPIDCNLWLKTKGNPDKIHLVIRQVNGFSQWYSFGQLAIDPPAEMKKVLDTGERVTVAGGRSDYVSVLAPVRTALGDVIGLVEVTTRRGVAG